MRQTLRRRRFSTLQRVEIAEMLRPTRRQRAGFCFSTLQRVEIAEIPPERRRGGRFRRFSTLQRVEIAEMPYAILIVVRQQGSFQYSSTSRNC